MRTPLIDGKAPGQFRARCTLTVAKLDAKLTVDERHEAKEKGYRRSYDRDSRNKVRWFVHFPQCGGFETDDPAAFVEHMRTVHGKKEVKGEAEAWAQGIRKMWRGPRLTIEGKPLQDKGGLTKTCGSCGLVAEVDDRAANVLWWDEHVRGCAIAQSVAS